MQTCLLAYFFLSHTIQRRTNLNYGYRIIIPIFASPQYYHILFTLKARFTSPGELIRAMTETRRELLQRAGEIPYEQWDKKPAENTWSAGEILHHIALTYDLVVNRMIAPLFAEEKPADFNSLELVKPSQGLSRNALEEALLTAQEDTILMIKKHFPDLRGLPKLRHPILGKVSARTWLYLLLRHERNHICQLQRTKTALETTFCRDTKFCVPAGNVG